MTIADPDPAELSAQFEAYRNMLRVHCYRMMRIAPFRPALEAIAHTLVYDATILGDGHVPLDRARSVRIPTLAIAAGAAPPFMRETAEALARAIPDGRALVLEGATHDLVPEVLTPPLVRFFGT